MTKKNHVHKETAQHREVEKYRKKARETFFFFKRERKRTGGDVEGDGGGENFKQAPRPA